MPDKPWPGPPAGVSTTDGRGGHQPIAAGERSSQIPEQHRKRQPRNGRKLQVGEDPLQNPEKFKVVEGNPNVPVGTNRVQRDVRVGPMPKTRRPRSHMTEFTSVDGNTYVIRTHDPKGKPVPGRNELCLFLAMIEMQKGGSPFPVFEAFKLKIQDAEGAQLFPVPVEVLNSLGYEPEYVDEEEAENSGFSLGE